MALIADILLRHPNIPFELSTACCASRRSASWIDEVYRYCGARKETVLCSRRSRLMSLASGEARKAGTISFWQGRHGRA
ncbi:MAG: hypothetical protein H6924_01355 [Alphaproteobacteria bacterium]|nr:hypothetical protein [Alphaproteobacteria bacterium]